MKNQILNVINILLGIIAAAGMVAFVIGAGCIDHPASETVCTVLSLGGAGVAFAACGLIYVINELRREI